MAGTVLTHSSASVRQPTQDTDAESNAFEVVDADRVNDEGEGGANGVIATR